VVSNCAVPEPVAAATPPAFHAVAPIDSLSDWALTPADPDWAAGFSSCWQPGEAGAHQALHGFLDGAVTRYQDRRDQPDEQGTSRLSPHLHFGEISPRQVWHTTRFAAAAAARDAEGSAAFLRQLVWREFSYYLLHHHPDMATTPLRSQYADFPWAPDPENLRRWQQGRTGYPLVDAGMRELWQTGWMHNRVRMVVASFLVKHLLIPWQEGLNWFNVTLVDADMANNAASWQWVAGCGTDASPYFRVFNPILQGQKFDPEGHYIKKWVPELAGLPEHAVHTPWELREPPAHYPEPVVDHASARQQALDAYAAMRGRLPGL